MARRKISEIMSKVARGVRLTRDEREYLSRYLRRVRPVCGRKKKYPVLVKEWRDRWGIGRLYIDRTESGKYYAYVVRPSLSNPVERISPLFRRKKDLEEWLKEGME
ncbi:MAG: hypothetical protein ACXQT6_00480 [Candidatus Methanospirareceae archaeon]